MKEVFLTYPTPEGSREIAMEGEKMSFGRGSEADFRFEDDGLSRLHATIYRDDDYIWVVDENSTNGTFVNGEKVSPRGTALADGDSVKIGHYTNLKITISEKKEELYSAPIVSGGTARVSVSETNLMSYLPLIVFGIGFFVISVSAVFIGITVFGGSDSEVVKTDDYLTPSESSVNKNADKAENSVSKAENKEKRTAESDPEDANTISLTESSDNASPANLPSGKKYQEMSEDEKNRYIAVKAEQVARIIGNQKSEPIPAEAVQEIKKYVNGYLSRLAKAKKDDCTQRGWLSSDFRTVLERASRNAPFIVRAFNAQQIDPQIGLYVAMIESEHCECLESISRAKGMFQFLASSAPDYGLHPDQRCEPEPSAKAAAKYLKSLIGRFGTAPDSVLLAIASYNSGQGHLSNNLDKVFSSAADQNRSFWTLVANKDVMIGRAGEQFNKENIHYVPKFFATAIIGENPQDFGVNMQKLSSYTSKK